MKLGGGRLDVVRNRVSRQIDMGPCAAAVAMFDSYDDETETGLEEDAITITDDAIREAGLDVWSAADKDFLVEMTRVYFNHQAVAAEGGVRICGVKVC